MLDTVEQIENAMVQHGKFSDRVYLMRLNDADPGKLIKKLDTLAQENQYTKIFGKVPGILEDQFLEAGYDVEARIPEFFKDDDGVFVARYLDENRAEEQDPATVLKVLQSAMVKKADPAEPRLEPPYELHVPSDAEAEAITRVYKEVFETYPFPVHDPEYIKKTMGENIVYFAVRRGQEIVSMASSEMDSSSNSVEMTDFATLPEHEGNGFATALLAKMEKSMTRRGLQTAYTIARACSFGMNVTFAKCGYSYAGTLTNNTNICGKMESMNVWWKPLN